MHYTTTHDRRRERFSVHLIEIHADRGFYDRVSCVKIGNWKRKKYRSVSPLSPYLSLIYCVRPSFGVRIYYIIFYRCTSQQQSSPSIAKQYFSPDTAYVRPADKIKMHRVFIIIVIIVIMYAIVVFTRCFVYIYMYMSALISVRCI